MIEIKIKDIERLPEAAAQFIKEMHPGKIYLFYGGMGVGKTTFISEIVSQLESEEEANSPTFSILNEYDTRNWGKIYHVDCYRLESEEEAFDAGLEDYFNSDDTGFIEWPEKIEGLFPDNAVRVEITAAPSGERIIKIYEDGLA